MDKTKIIKELEYLTKKTELKGFNIFYPVLKKQYKDVASFVRQHGLENTVQALPMLIQADEMQKAMIQFYSEAGLIHAKWQYRKLYEGYKSLGGSIAKFARSWLKDLQMYVYYNLGNMIQDINQNTLNVIKKELNRYIQEGYGAEKAARLMDKELAGELGKRRALLITRTEGTRAASKGHKLASESWSKETGSRQYKQWIPIIDNRTRPDHKDMDEQPPIPAEEKFNVGGNGMDAPGDPNAPIEETANCRCRAVYLSERMLNRQL
ncbi:Phage Mu protein F like protein [Arachidicoccus rhizosphaerae]|uniref:Phage Mu protein F like protein n=1 Tax=Arachidicoccus rhizosphaerae TaxID=551991 RepID=A0A1H3W6B1_9BACT|nr:phage minor head protein [Arachidicoccus rhizosphaerae]SDZ82371.1 Phage Mu protein F like protein [Arachidicoccus rhizosphaerae]